MRRSRAVRPGGVALTRNVFAVLIGIVQRAHRRIQVFDAHAIQLAPRWQIHLFNARFHVKRGQPVDALNRAFGQPRLDACVERVCFAVLRPHQCRHAAFFQSRHQRAPTPPRSIMTITRECSSSVTPVALAPIERRAQGRRGHTARNAVGVLQRPDRFDRRRRFGATSPPARMIPATTAHWGRWPSGGSRSVHSAPPRKANHLFQRRIIAQFQIFLTRNIKHLADGGKGLRLLDRINPQIRFQVDIEVEHLLRIARFWPRRYRAPVGDDLSAEDAANHRGVHSRDGGWSQHGRRFVVRHKPFVGESARACALAARSGRIVLTNPITAFSVG